MIQLIRFSSGTGRAGGYASMAVIAIALCWLTAAAADDIPNGTLAGAIRASGHPCERVLSKEQISQNPSTWQVRCNSGSFQVTMTKDAPPKVVRLD
jgi:hypothetical protein